MKTADRDCAKALAAIWSDNARLRFRPWSPERNRLFVREFLDVSRVSSTRFDAIIDRSSQVEGGE